MNSRFSYAVTRASLAALAALTLVSACTPTNGRSSTPAGGDRGASQPAATGSGSGSGASGSGASASRASGSGASGSGASASAASASGASGSADEAGATCVAGLVDNLNATERAGQLFMVAVTPDVGLTGVTRQVASGSVGGVIYLGGWSVGSAGVRATSRQLQTAATGDVRLFVAADQEGGQIQQLTGPGFTSIPAATEQGTWPAAELTRSATGWARELAAAGVNVNLAPVADTVSADIGAANAPIGAHHREYGSTPATVAPAVAAFVAGMHEGGVAATIKHFPGIGRISGNTDTTAGGITDSVATESDPNLGPFAAGIAAGVDIVMVSTARYPRMDPDNQAIFSRAIVTGLLRERMGWAGVVVTDDVGAARSVAAVPIGDRATRFVAAGGDIVLTARSSDIAPMQHALAARSAADPAFAAQVDAAVGRVLTLKTARGLTSCQPR